MFLLFQIMDGKLQFRYNLGSGEALLIVNFIQVNDEQFHNVTITRTERRAEIVLDGRYANRTTSSGSEVTLDITADSMYFGASVDAQNSTVINAFSGCVTGFTLDQKEVPIGGENLGFTTLEISESAQRGCPIGRLYESPQPEEYVYIGIVVILIVLFLISGCFVVIVTIIKLCRRRRGRYSLNIRRGSRRGSSRRRNWTSSRRGASPTHVGFQWQPATNKRDMSIPLGLYQSTPQHEQENPFDFNINNMNSNDTDDRPEFPGKLTSFPLLTTAETSFNNSNCRSSTRSQPRATPVEGFTFSQQNQSFQSESLTEPDGQTQVQELKPVERKTNRPMHVRSFSGHQSIQSTSTVATSILQDDTNVTKYLRKRLAIANDEISELNLDEMKQFKEEGPYQPLGSVGSLLDFVENLDSETKLDISEFQLPPDSPKQRDEETPTHSNPLLNSHVATHLLIDNNDGVEGIQERSNPKKVKSRSTIHPLTGQHFEDTSIETVPSKESISYRDKSKGKHSATKNSIEHSLHSKRMENILERFHSITAGHKPISEHEGRMV